MKRVLLGALLLLMLQQPGAYAQSSWKNWAGTVINALRGGNGYYNQQYYGGYQAPYGGYPSANSGYYQRQPGYYQQQDVYSNYGASMGVTQVNPYAQYGAYGSPYPQTIVPSPYGVQYPTQAPVTPQQYGACPQQQPYGVYPQQQQQPYGGWSQW